MPILLYYKKDAESLEFCDESGEDAYCNNYASVYLSGKLQLAASADESVTEK
jgi:hypothetical protein